VDPVTLVDEVRRCGVLPVVSLDDASAAVAVGSALAAGGLPLIEVTFRTDAAPDAIRRLSTERPDLLVGAGTILEVGQAETAVDAGARFLVTPGFSASLAAWAGGAGVPIVPGVQTATEVMAALELGLDVLKFFPAAIAGGPTGLDALSGPFPDVSFIPTGGIGPSDLGDYLVRPNVLACGGTWLTPPEAVAAGDVDSIETAAREAVRLVAAART
jgi:2-dehydro-3-deoxyphosphogluconate aldolase/(4S)-4-hydroxy-2-oxoglutarate aldolase